jgi:hypothetical protein
MGIAKALRFAQANAVDQARVIQGVADNRIAFVEKRLEQARIRIEAGAVEDGVGRSQKMGDVLFEMFMKILGPANESDGRHPIAMLA